MFFCKVTAVRFESTPLRNGALSHLRPLGQTVLINNGWVKACKAHQPEAVLTISGISGLVAECIVAIDVTRVRFSVGYVIDIADAGEQQGEIKLSIF